MAHYLEHNWPNVRYTLATEPANPLQAGLERILQVVQQALATATCDADRLNALSTIQGATMAAEMEHFGPEETYEDNDIPF